MEGLLATLSQGGPIVALLALISLGSLGLIGAKAAQLRGVLGGRERRAAALELWHSGDRHAALRETEAGDSPADRLLREAMAGLKEGQPRAALDARLEWRGNAEMARMYRHIRLLELTAMISPLLGLLGTVLGMIRAFQDLAMAEGAANAAMLADGIWQALLTTAAGLLVAIPAAVAAALLNARVERAGEEIEAAVGRLMAEAPPGR